MLNKLNSLRGKEEGFTLIELLIVVIIIGILAAIALPIFIDQQKVAIDASVKSDVRNTVTNVTNMQATQDAASFKIARSNSNTVEVRVGGEAVAAASPTATTTLAAPIALGTAYTVDGYNAGGKAYSDASTAYTFNSSTGNFSVTDVSLATSWTASSARPYVSTFEDGATSDTLFQPNGTAFVNVTDQAHNGTHSLVNHTGVTGGTNDAGFAYKNLTVGSTYTFEGWYYLSSSTAQPSNLSATVSSYVSGSQKFMPITGNDLTPNAWHKFSFTTSAGYTTGNTAVIFSNTNSAKLYLDDVKITPVN